MTIRPLDIAIVGAGMGGLAAAACLRRVGINVTIYEQAERFSRLGAGIQQTPNAMKVLRKLGLEQRVRDASFRPAYTRYREAVTAEILWHKDQGDAFEQKFGAPHLLMHRADLHETLASVVPSGIIRHGKRLAGFDQDRNGVTLGFADGSRVSADALIACDGVHSIVRDALLGPEKPRWTGRVAFRTVFPAKLIGDLQIDDCSKWMSEDRHIVFYYTNPRRDEVYFVTSTPEPGFDIESWSSKGDMDELRAYYKDFHPDVRAVLAACPEVHKWALVERDPLPKWGEGRVVLLGDACHPMTPYMAQGAATSIEDAALMSRCLEGIDADGLPHAFRIYEATRKPRTSRIQTISALNSIEKIRAEIDATYSYNVWSTPLIDPDRAPLRKTA